MRWKFQHLREFQLSTFEGVEIDIERDLAAEKRCIN